MQSICYQARFGKCHWNNFKNKMEGMQNYRLEGRVEKSLNLVEKTKRGQAFNALGTLAS